MQTTDFVRIETIRIRVYNKFSFSFSFSLKATMMNPCNQFVFYMHQNILNPQKTGFVVSTLNVVVFPSYFPHVFWCVCAEDACVCFAQTTRYESTNVAAYTAEHKYDYFKVAKYTRIFFFV